MDKYQELLISKPQFVGQLESTVRSIALFLPGKFQNSRFTSQLILCLLRTLSYLNDSILFKLLNITKSSHTRYTQRWLKNFYYKRISWLLTILQTWEAAIEMLAMKFTRDEELPNVIIAIETVKAALRIMILKITKRQVLKSVVPIREYNLATVQINQTWTGKRLKKEYPRVEFVNPDDLFSKVY